MAPHSTPYASGLPRVNSCTVRQESGWGAPAIRTARSMCARMGRQALTATSASCRSAALPRRRSPHGEVRNDVVVGAAVGRVLRELAPHRRSQVPERLRGLRRQPQHVVAEPLAAFELSVERVD